MIFFSIILLVLVLTADALLGLIVWLQSTRRKINVIFALLTLAFIGWSATGFYDQTTTDLAGLRLMAGVPFLGGLFIVYFITLFSLYFPETHPNAPGTRRKITWALNLTSLPLILITTFGGPAIIANVTTSATVGNNVVPGPLYIAFPLYYLGWLGFALANLFLKYRRSRRQLERIQLTYIFTGFLSMTGVALVTNVALPIIVGNPTLSRFGFLSTLFIIGCFGYTIVAHRLFNIRLIVARSVAYILLLTTLTILYGLAIFATSNLFFQQSDLSTGEIAVFIALALVLALTYQPLRRFFEKITDGVFFRDRYDSQVVLNNIGSILASEIDIDTLLNRCLAEVCSSLHVASGRFVIYGESEIYKRVFYGQSSRQLLDIKIIQQLHPGTLVADELPNGKRKSILEAHGIRVALELRTKENLVGHLLLGDKLSGDIYSNQDVKLLEILRKELAIAIVNAKAYEEIARFNVTLQEQIRKATERLRAANKNLKVLDKAKDEFISMASHQLGTPLTAIMGYLTMALDDDKRNMTKSQKEYVQYALEASERMGAMSSDLLNVSRLSAGRFVIRREPVDLNQMAAQEIDQMRAAADRKGLKLIFTPATNLPLVPADVSKTRQVIMNFIDNAIYYTESGSVKVRIEHEHNAVALTVTDTGMGVPPAEKAKLFTKFYRAGNAKSARPDGTGLGLYLAKRVIEDQGGSIIFESELGHGSTFGFVLPLGPASAPTPNTAPAKANA
jgi:signal transduction histidine kinase